MSRLVSALYKLARRLNDLEKVSSGSPKKIARRGKNKLIGRIISPKIYGRQGAKKKWR